MPAESQKETTRLVSLVEVQAQHATQVTVLAAVVPHLWVYALCSGPKIFKNYLIT